MVASTAKEPIAERRKKEILLALVDTVSMVLPHAAQAVEKKAQELVGYITQLVNEAAVQENCIAQLVGNVQHMRIADKELPLPEYLQRLQVTLAFSLESNLHHLHMAGEWNASLEEKIDALSKTAQDVDAVASNGGRNARQLRDFSATVQRAVQGLISLKSEIEGVGIDQTERELYTKDMRMIAQVISEQPLRAQQLHALLGDANASARKITEAGRAAVMAIQFQDRNTQLIENAMRLLAKLREGIDDENEGDVQAYMDACYGVITLGEVRDMFLDALQESNPNAGGHESHVDSAHPIELF